MGDSEGRISEFDEDTEKMESNPKQSESTNWEGNTKKAKEATEQNEEKPDKATDGETEEETTYEEWNGPYRIWAAHREDTGQDQAS